MFDAILNINKQIFSFPPVLYCCAMTLVVAMLGLIRRFLTGNFDMTQR